ncbi:amidohydrolase family protein [Aliihoeflea aestuarii]|jgi:predicted amidohydrolase YtcJ|uniref:amidohydrolase n=1 Tax=Aliihoeflea aestuarii TaxID=453840 RepID=UPI00209507E0|nr:amidohydrolase [Aliihoeflea aestuarii]MCO6392976.1 amidohydrolase family protein [Aliihoeflea aestuarii]
MTSDQSHSTNAEGELDRIDCVLSNGRIWKGLGLGFAEAIAIRDGRVEAIGTNDEITPLAARADKVIDLAGRLAVPGLNDAHMHLLPYGTAMAEVDLRPGAAPTLAALLSTLRARAAETPKGGWVIGRGYDHFQLDVKRHPYREELDQACPDHPVYIVRTDGHLAIANSRALELAGIDEDTPSPEGGLIERQNGRLTGLLAETGREPVMKIMPRASVDALVASIERGGMDLLSYGITSCMEAAVGIRDGWAEMEAYLKAHANGRLPVRTYACLMGDKTRSILAKARDAGLVTGTGDDMFRIGPVKIFTDGSAGGRTAAMTKPYKGGDEHDKGILCIPDDEELAGMVLDAHRAGYQMAIHAIGDAAIDQVLDAYEAALADTPDPQRRHRIEHCGWLRDDQMHRMRQMHVLPAPQPSFLYYFGDLYLSILEEERVAASHPMRKWIDAGLNPSASTDCPVTEIAPLPVIYNMVTRKTRQGTLIGGEHALSMEEALHAYTWCSAYAARDEKNKGQLIKGQLGDIAVFDRDLFEIDADAILDAVCDLTILGGKVVYERTAG